LHRASLGGGKRGPHTLTVRGVGERGGGAMHLFAKGGHVVERQLLQRRQRAGGHHQLQEIPSFHVVS
jgi:hypothetical protein